MNKCKTSKRKLLTKNFGIINERKKVFFPFFFLYLFYDNLFEQCGGGGGDGGLRTEDPCGTRVNNVRELNKTDARISTENGEPRENSKSTAFEVLIVKAERIL